MAGASAVVALLLVLCTSAAAYERRSFSGAKHASALIFEIHGVDNRAVVKGYVAIGRYRRSLPVLTVRRAARRGSLRLRLDRALRRRLTALRRAARGRRTPKLVIVTRALAVPVPPGPLTGPILTPPVVPIDTEPPVTLDDVPVGVQNGPRAVTLAAQDQDGGTVAETRYQVFSGAAGPDKAVAGWRPYDPAVKPILADGQRIAYYSADAHGNEERVRSSLAIAVDTQPPATVDDVPSSVQDGPRAVMLAVSDPGPAEVAETQYRVYTGAAVPAKTDAGWQRYDPAHKPVLDDGQQIAYYSVDTAGPQGNEEDVRHSVPLSVEYPPASGEPMPVGDLPGWHQVFTDDFTKPVPLGSFPAAVADKWRAYTDGTADTSGYGTYYPSKVVSVHDGVLDKWIHTEDGLHMVAAPFPRIPGRTVKGGLYGRFAARFRSDPIEGYKAAWLLWPDSDVWPRDGEIDFPEGSLDGTMCAFLHHQGATSGDDQTTFCTQATFESWHTAVIEWAPDRTSFYLDGTLIGTTADRVPNTPMYWVIQTETRHSAPPPDAAVGHVYIDWVAIWDPAEPAAQP